MDVFGMAFRDYLEGETDGHIQVFTSLSGRETVPVAYFFRSYDTMPPWEQQVLDRCSGRILDAGAGAGCHSLELQRRGLDVTAIDISAGAVEVMRRRGLRQVHLSDFFELQGEPDSFDTVLFLMNGAGIARDLDGLQALLSKVARLLHPEGTVYLESTDLMYMYEDDDGSVVIPMGSRYYGEIEYRLRYKGHWSGSFPWLFVDPDNLADIAARCGLATEIIYQGSDHNYIASLRLPAR